MKSTPKEGDRAMTKRTLWLMALIPVLGLSSVPANACIVVGQANGETLCATASDSANHRNPGKKTSSSSYTNSPVWVQTRGSIQITTSKSANSSRVLVRHNSSEANATRIARHWH
jgi:hypothetical protein